MAKTVEEFLTQAQPPALVVKPVKNYDVEANFDDVAKYLQGINAKYADVVWTEDNIKDAEEAKKELRSLRSSLEDIQDSVKKERYNDPKKRFDEKMNDLIGIISSVEQSIDLALKSKDQERIDDIKSALDLHAKELQKKYSLRPEYLEQVSYPKQYFNKTAKESETRANLELQFKSLRASQVMYDQDIKHIHAELEGYPEISEDAVLKLWDGGDGLGMEELGAWIKKEKERVDDLRAGVERTPELKAKPTKAFPAPSESEFKTDFPGKTKELTIKITYPVDVGDSLTKLFKSLEAFGIKTRPVKNA